MTTSYSLTKRPPSCFVGQKLLTELEEYVQRKLSEFEEADEKLKDYLQGGYRFIVIDSSGEEVLQSVKDFKRSYFPDDTLKLRLNGYTKRRNLDIDIVFTRHKELSKIDVSFSGKSARETVAGIASEIDTILNSYKNSNYLYHSWHGAAFSVIICLLMLAMAWAARIVTPKTAWIWLVVLGLSSGVAATSFASAFKPYCTFETRRAERRSRQVSWVVLGFIGFILFTVVGVYFRQKIFGF